MIKGNIFGDFYIMHFNLERNKMKLKPTFQFSSIDKKIYVDKLEEAIKRLDGIYDGSKVVLYFFQREKDLILPI